MGKLDSIVGRGACKRLVGNKFNCFEPFTGIAWSEKFSFALNPARANDQFATDSDRNLPKVIAHSKGS
jgi:hypothetical protein